MKAIVYTQYGPPEVLQLKEVEKPCPKDDEILIRVKASAVNSGDLKIRRADPFAVRLFFGLFGPRKTIPGVVLSGEIEKTGKDVTRFKAGDRVFGSAGLRFGAFAQYISLPENEALALKPDVLSDTEAAAIPFGATTALYFLKKAKVRSGQRVLVYGASGAVGTAAVQLAKHLGATVTGVCSTTNLAMVKSLGADKVIDYTKENFTENGETYDVIFETVGKLSYADSLKSLSSDGTLILGAAGVSEMLKGAWTSMSGARKVLNGMAVEKAEDMDFLKELIQRGELRPVIDRTYPLEKAAAAHAYAEMGHKKGNVAIEIG